MQNNRSFDDIKKMDISPKSVWSNIRAHLDLFRRSKLALPEFLHHNFEMSNTVSEKACETILALCQRCVQDLEIVEAQHRDIIDILGTEKATEMAMLSIQESKRVMLCKYDVFSITEGLDQI